MYCTGQPLLLLCSPFAFKVKELVFLKAAGNLVKLSSK